MKTCPYYAGGLIERSGMKSVERIWDRLSSASELQSKLADYKRYFNEHLSHSVRDVVASPSGEALITCQFTKTGTVIVPIP